MQAEEILIGCFVECQSIKNVGGRRSVEELYQALFFVSVFHRQPRRVVCGVHLKIEKGENICNSTK